MMTNENIYEIWRPEHSPWSLWVKPVVFSFLSPCINARDEYRVQEWPVLLPPDTAIIADLPGGEGVSVGIAMARAGYRPVLLYNACPTGTSGYPSPEPVSPPVVVDMSAILTAVCGTTKELGALSLSAQSPPVFLLDGNRGGVGIPYGPGWFDNRSFVTPSDFPSADCFRQRGITKMILIQAASDIKADLLPVLLRLQQDGMMIAMQAPWKAWGPVPILVKPPMFLISAWEWLRRKLGYRRNSFHGCFGEVVPPSSS
jgi:hypothetical protein